MIGNYIGSPIGLQITTPNPATRQIIRLSGFVLFDGDDCFCRTDQEYDLDAGVVEANDVRLRLEIYDQDGNEIALDGFGGIYWTLRPNINGPVILQKSLQDGITVTDAIYVSIDGDEIDGFHGNYVHEFLIVKDGNLATVVADGNLAYGDFVIRKKIAIP